MNAVTTYRFQVFAENGVSSLAGRSEYIDITVTTDATVPSLVSNVRINNIKSTELSINWDAPLTDMSGISDTVEKYEGKSFFFFSLYNSFLLFALSTFYFCRFI